MNKKHIILFLCASLIIITPFLINKGEITGSDEAANLEIQQLGYTPWFESIWEPSNNGIETLLFGIQAAIGLVIIALFLGYYKKKQNS